MKKFLICLCVWYSISVFSKTEFIFPKITSLAGIDFSTIDREIIFINLDDE